MDNIIRVYKISIAIYVKIAFIMLFRSKRKWFCHV